MQLKDPTPSGDVPILALFDMDRTLLTANSASLWLRFEHQEGRLSRLDVLRGLVWLLQYKLGRMDMGAVTERALALSAGHDARLLEERIERWHRQMVRPTISRKAVGRLEAHRRAGHDLAILTASTQFGASLVARELGVEHLVCTRLEVGADGLLTGRVEGNMCYGEGKLKMALSFADERRASLEEAWFYSDSYTDLPLLEVVGNPVAVNPDPRLSRHAKTAGWPIVRFD